MATPKHILVARTDKIGDLLLSLPVFQVLKERYPDARLTALVAPYAREIVEGHPAVDGVELFDPGESLFTLAGRIRALEADVFLSLYPRAGQAWAAFAAGVPVRVGTAYRWYSFLFNKRVRVHRSACDRHEVEYNLDLVRALGLEPAAPALLFPLSEEHRAFARDLLDEKGLKPGMSYVAVHPGHKGSALNWKPERYGEIIAHLSQQKGLRVVVTAGPDETQLIGKVSAFHGSLPGDQKPILLIGECGLKQLAAVYEGASCFLSGSTGTMHLAAAVGTPTVSLFCPIPETTPVRWGPWGNESTVLMPKGLDCEDCRKGRCARHDPMDAISGAEVFQAMEKFIHKKKK